MIQKREYQREETRDSWGRKEEADLDLKREYSIYGRRRRNRPQKYEKREGEMQRIKGIQNPGMWEPPSHEEGSYRIAPELGSPGEKGRENDERKLIEKKLGVKGGKEEGSEMKKIVVFWPVKMLSENAFMLSRRKKSSCFVGGKIDVPSDHTASEK